MLFASTRLTLVRELGIERFRETIFVNREEELSAEGFTRHDKHNELEAPLTEEEVSLGEVKRKEAEEGRGAGERKSHVSSGVSMPVSGEALGALKELAGGDGEDRNLVQLVRILDSRSSPVEVLMQVANQYRDRDDGTRFRDQHTDFFPTNYHIEYITSIFILPLHPSARRRYSITYIIHLHLSPPAPRSKNVCSTPRLRDLQSRLRRRKRD